MNLSSVLSRIAPLEVPFGDETLKVQYRVGAITPRLLEELDTMSLDPALCRLLESWDLVNDGEPVPITEAALAEIPVPFKREVYRRVLEDVFPNLKRDDS